MATNSAINSNQTLATTSSVTFASLSLTSPLTVANGGTGAATFTANGLLYGNGTGAIQAMAAMTNGQIAIGSTGGAPVNATITAGSNISVTNGAGSITIGVTGVQTFSWTTVSGTSQSMAVNSGYVANNAGLVTLTLPTTAAVGDEIIVNGLGAGGWKVAQNASQLINFGNVVTTTGTGGSLASSNQFDNVTLRCMVANTTWTVNGVQGNLTYV